MCPELGAIRHDAVNSRGGQAERDDGEDSGEGALQDGEDICHRGRLPYGAHLVNRKLPIDQLKAFDGGSAFSTWFTRIAINSALMTLRRKRARPESCMEVMDGESWRPWEVADQTKDIERHFLKQENEQRLRRAICRLKPSLRNVGRDSSNERRDDKGNRRHCRNLYWGNQGSLIPRQSHTAHCS